MVMVIKAKAKIWEAHKMETNQLACDIITVHAESSWETTLLSFEGGLNYSDDIRVLEMGRLWSPGKEIFLI